MKLTLKEMQNVYTHGNSMYNGAGMARKQKKGENSTNCAGRDRNPHTKKKKNVLTAYTKIDSREFNGQI